MTTQLSYLTIMMLINVSVYLVIIIITISTRSEIKQMKKDMEGWNNIEKLLTNELKHLIEKIK